MNRFKWHIVILCLTIVFVSFTTLYFKKVSGLEDPEAGIIESESDFSDRRVLVVLDRESSLEFKTYSVDDFPEIECVDVINLTPGTELIAKESIKKGNTSVLYNKILCIEIKYPGKDNVMNAISILKTNNHVLSAEPDYFVSICDTTPNDTYYDDYQWGNDKIDLPSAWDEETGSMSVYVGVIDSGIDGTHPDLSGRIRTDWCVSFLTNTAVAETNPTDPYGHGTHVAGIIGAAGNNNLGVCGVCWNVKLVSIKVIDSSGNGCSSRTIMAIDYAESKSIPIINLSLGSFSFISAMETAINNYSGLAVCAAGNYNTDTDITPFYPACYSCSNIISVGKSDSNDDVANDSNYGATSVDIFAPGQGILSTYPLSICNSGACNTYTHISTGYHTKNGTSMAAPYVAGVAALIKSSHPNITVAQLKSAILDNGDACSSLTNKCLTGSRLNAYNALHSVHSFTAFVDYGNPYYHKSACSVCGLFGPKSIHDWVPNLLHTRYTCSKCGATTTNPVYPREE